MALSTRVLTTDDAPAWKALRIEAVEAYPSAFLASAEEARAMPPETVAQMLAQGMTLGLFEGAELAGMAGLRRLPFARAAHRVEIGGFYVRPRLHGQGAAERLMQAIVDHAMALGVWQLELCVAEQNARAIRFYERRGFVRQGRMPNTVVDPDGPETDLFYTRDLRG